MRHVSRQSLQPSPRVDELMFAASIIRNDTSEMRSDSSRRAIGHALGTVDLDPISRSLARTIGTARQHADGLEPS